MLTVEQAPSSFFLELLCTLQFVLCSMEPVDPGCASAVDALVLQFHNDRNGAKELVEKHLAFFLFLFVF